MRECCDEWDSFLFRVFIFFRKVVCPVPLEEGGYLTFDGTKEASGITARSKGLKKGPGAQIAKVFWAKTGMPFW